MATPQASTLEQAQQIIEQIYAEGAAMAETVDALRTDRDYWRKAQEAERAVVVELRADNERLHELERHLLEVLRPHAAKLPGNVEARLFGVSVARVDVCDDGIIVTAPGANEVQIALLLGEKLEQIMLEASTATDYCDAADCEHQRSVHRRGRCDGADCACTGFEERHSAEVPPSTSDSGPDAKPGSPANDRGSAGAEAPREADDRVAARADQRARELVGLSGGSSPSATAPAMADATWLVRCVEGHHVYRGPWADAVKWLRDGGQCDRHDSTAGVLAEDGWLERGEQRVEVEDVLSIAGLAEPSVAAPSSIEAEDCAANGHDTCHHWQCGNCGTVYEPDVDGCAKCDPPAPVP